MKKPTWIEWIIINFEGNLRNTEIGSKIQDVSFYYGYSKKETNSTIKDKTRQILPQHTKVNTNGKTSKRFIVQEEYFYISNKKYNLTNKGKEFRSSLYEKYDNYLKSISFEHNNSEYHKIKEIITTFQNKFPELSNKSLYEMERIVRSRTKQSFFRKELLNVFNNKCFITGVNSEKLLIASHIVAYKDCGENGIAVAYAKIDPNNGILLSPNVDKLFDRKVITFDDVTGELKIIEEKERENIKIMIPNFNNIKINLWDGNFESRREFLKKRNNNIFGVK